MERHEDASCVSDAFSLCQAKFGGAVIPRRPPAAGRWNVHPFRLLRGGADGDEVDGTENREPPTCRGRSAGPTLPGPLRT